MTDARDDFYVGYLPESPGALGAWTRARARVLLLLSAAVALALVASQGTFSKAAFEFGVETDLEGWIGLEPYPNLVVPHPADQTTSRYLLTVYGKRGAGDAVREYDGERVRLRGSLIYRDDQTMVEVLPDSIEPVLVAGESDPPPPVIVEDLGERTLRGEIVDSKCFFGVMKPGNLKPHRACATRCIAGGIPPVLLVRDADGRASYFLLASETGGMVNEAVLDKIAEPVEITGRLRRYDNLHVLSADPETYQRLE